MTKILAAIDSSPTSRDVLAAALAFAAKSDAKVVLFHAVPVPLASSEPILMSVESLGHDMLGEARAHLDTLVEEAAHPSIDSVDVAFGTPWSGICDAAKKHDVELIVIGARSYDFLDKVLGTTASKVVHGADRSVLVVRDPAVVPPVAELSQVDPDARLDDAPLVTEAAIN